jgi:mannonate dehydratase
MKITSAKVIVTCPGRNLVTLKIMTDEGVHGLGDATLNGREKAVVAYLEEHVSPLPDRARPAPHRGHLAVSLQGRLLAARTRDHVGDRGGRHRAVGRQGEGAGLPLYQLLGGKSRDA